MNVLLYSHMFYPSVGGLETVSQTLANEFVENNIHCKVITTTPISTDIHFPYKIYRNPSIPLKIKLILWADIILFNGASLALQPYILFLRKPFIWIHTGYQVSCIDGCGWVNGIRAPISPWASIKFHLKYHGWKFTLIGTIKLIIKRFFAQYFVTKNIAITKWMLDIQELPRQIQIYNPFPLNNFKNINTSAIEYDFFFLGRLVSEKGISTLLQAFSNLLLSTGKDLKLLIIGDGNWRSKMEALADELAISSYVYFAGEKSGLELSHYISKAKIGIIPSEWYEPMGGVAIELMAAKKNLIVSELGGLKECVGNAGLTFINGDPESLEKCMSRIINDKNLRKTQLQIGKKRINKFLPNKLIFQYIEVLKEGTS